MREAPAHVIIRALLEEGATVRAFDPEAGYDDSLVFMQRHVMLNHLERMAPCQVIYREKCYDWPSRERSRRKLKELFEKEPENGARSLKQLADRHSRMALALTFRHLSRTFPSRPPVSWGKIPCPIGNLNRQAVDRQGKVIGDDTFPIYFCTMCYEILDDKEEALPHYAIHHMTYEIEYTRNATCLN